MVTTHVEKDFYYLSISLRLVNGANDTEICQYEIRDLGTFCHVSIFMDELLVSEMSAAGSELVISSCKEDLVSKACIFLIPTNKKHLGGEVACNLIDNLKMHKSSVREYVPRIEFAKRRLEDEFRNVVIHMNFRGIHALGLRNFVIERTYRLDDVPIYIETFGASRWEKHRQVLFLGLIRLKHLDLELGSSCRNLVEKPVFNHFEACVSVGNLNLSNLSVNYRFTRLRYPPMGASENFYSLIRIIPSHKAETRRTHT